MVVITHMLKKLLKISDAFWYACFVVIICTPFAQVIPQQHPQASLKVAIAVKIALEVVQSFEVTLKVT